MADLARLESALRKADALARTGDARAALDARRIAEEIRTVRAAPQTSTIEQFGKGTSEGIANIMGLPGDLYRKGAEAIGLGVPENPSIFGVEIPIVGGSDYWNETFPQAPDPQTAAHRIARRTGHDVGAGVMAAPVGGISSLGGMGLNALADGASGLAGGVVSEVTENPLVDLFASLGGGMGVVGASKAMRQGPQAPTNNALRAREDALWQQVRDSNVRLTPRAAQELKGNVSAKAYDMRMKPSLHGPEAPAAVDEVWGLADRPSLWEVEEARRFIGENTPRAFDKASTARITTGLKREIDAYLDGIPHPDAAIAKDARDVSRRRIASEKLDRTIDKAERRAASTGTGGNSINTQRQNVNSLLNNQKDVASFTPAEQVEMRRIVDGQGGTNALRLAGSLSPDRGGLPLMLNIAGAGGAAAGFASGNTGIAALSVAPGVIGYIAKQIGETLTDKQIRNLSEIIRNGGPVGPKRLSREEQAVLRALAVTQGANTAQQ